MPRHLAGSCFALALCVAACGGGTGSHNRFPPDSGTNLAPDTAPPATDDAGPDIASPAPPDVGPEATLATDTRDVADDQAVPDGRDASGDDTTNDTLGATACAADLSGTSPFGKALSGTGSFAPTFGTAAPITSAMTAYIYFPVGRVAGAPVQLGVHSRVVTTQYFFGPPVTLASDLSAAGLTVGGHDLQITGNLLPGAGGLQATIGANFSSPGTDVADDRTADMLMCPGGDVPAPTLRVTGGNLSPLSTLGFYASTPLSTEGLGALLITSPLGAVTTRVSSERNSRFSAGPNFTVTASSAFPPGQPLTFDVSGVKDVLGRDVPLSLATTQVLATTAVLDDLTLTTTPPTGAISCSGCSASMFPGVDGGAMQRCTGGGKLSNGVLGVGFGGPYTAGPVDALLALPTTSSTKLRVRMAVGDVVEAGSSCRNGSYLGQMANGIMAVVGPNGEASAPVSLTCDGTMADHVIDLPSASALWLIVHVEGYALVPYFMPTPGPPSINIDELQFM
jgi:hypothetical protein